MEDHNRPHCKLQWLEKERVEPSTSLAGTTGETYRDASYLRRVLCRKPIMKKTKKGGSSYEKMVWIED